MAKQFEELKDFMSKKSDKAVPMDDKTASAKEQVLKELVEMMQGVRASQIDNELKTVRNNPLSHQPGRAARKAEHTINRLPSIPEDGDAEEVSNESNKETMEQDKKTSGPNISEADPLKKKKKF